MHTELIVQSFCAQNYQKSGFLFILIVQNASICIRMHENVCKMNAKIFCTQTYHKSAFVYRNGPKMAS